MFKYMSKLVSKIYVKYTHWKEKTNSKILRKDTLELVTGLNMLKGVETEFPKVLGESPSTVFLLSGDHAQRWMLCYNTGSFWSLCYNTGKAPTVSCYLLDVMTHRLKPMYGVKISNDYVSYRKNPGKIEILETYVPNLGNPILGKYVVKDI